MSNKYEIVKPDVKWQDITEGGIMEEDAFLNDMEGSFKHKFAKKPEVIEGNMNALKRSLQEVKGL